MNYAQNEKIAQVTEKTLIVGVDIGGENHYARAFNWRGQELSKKAFRFSDDILGYQAFGRWISGHREKLNAEKVIYRLRTNRALLVQLCTVRKRRRHDAGTGKSVSCQANQGTG